jgi:hypothetical protein
MDRNLTFHLSLFLLGFRIFGKNKLLFIKGRAVSPLQMLHPHITDICKILTCSNHSWISSIIQRALACVSTYDIGIQS